MTTPELIAIIATMIGCTWKLSTVISSKVDHTTCATRQAKCPCVKWMDEHKDEHIRNEK